MAMEKKYYSISEVAEMLGVKTSRIRYWESKFPRYVNPRRSRRGDRMFSQKDIENLKTIIYLVEDLGLKLDGVDKFLKHHKDDIEAKLRVIEKLKNVKHLLEELRDSID